MESEENSQEATFAEMGDLVPKLANARREMVKNYGKVPAPNETALERQRLRAHYLFTDEEVDRYFRCSADDRAAMQNMGRQRRYKAKHPNTKPGKNADLKKMTSEERAEHRRAQNREAQARRRAKATEATLPVHTEEEAEARAVEALDALMRDLKG